MNESRLMDEFIAKQLVEKPTVFQLGKIRNGCFEIVRIEKVIVSTHSSKQAAIDQFENMKEKLQ